MCGVIGLFLRKGSVDPALFERQRDVMRHRGPDDAGIWLSSDGRLALGSRRLAILDLTPAGRMPMEDERGRTRIVFNGEIYNFQDVREELLKDGFSFESGSDTEVVLKAYLRWGVECLDRLDGMFALAIHDQRDGDKLFLARDRAGEKPLYYRLSDEGFAFASELKALLIGGGGGRLDHDAFAEYLAYGYVSGASCLIQGFRKLPPAHAMLYDCVSGKAKTWRYWTPPEPAHDSTADPRELEEDLESLLLDSVRRRLVADVPVGVLLSGGVDSSLITAMAARSGNRPRTFTITFPGHGAYDEGPYARKVADWFGTEHVELQAEPLNVDLLPDLAALYDEPLADSSLLPTFLVCRLCRSRVTVALGGDGGDELFGGYGHYVRALAMLRRRAYLPGSFRRLSLPMMERLPVGLKGRAFALELLRGAPEAACAANVFDARARGSILAAGALRELGARSLPERLRRADWREGAGTGEENVIDGLTRLDFGRYFPDDILVKVDRASMGVSLEARAPWLDRRIMEFAFGRVPAKLKTSAREGKILPRRLAKRLLPPDLDLDRKQGFSLPLAEWLAGPWNAFVVEVLSQADETLFSRKALMGLMEGQRKGRSNATRLFAIIMFELWRRQYGITA